MLNLECPACAREIAIAKPADDPVNCPFCLAPIELIDNIDGEPGDPPYYFALTDEAYR